MNEILEKTTIKGKPEPIEKDFKEIRKDRQDDTNKSVYESLKNGDQKKLRENINDKEYKRTLGDLKFTEEDFLSKCKLDDSFAILASKHISKNASRQGGKDEKVQLKTCNLTAVKCGLAIENFRDRQVLDGDSVDSYKN